MLLHQAVLITYADGEQTDSERKVLSELAVRLRIGPDESNQILDSGAQHAQKLLHLLTPNSS